MARSAKEQSKVDNFGNRKSHCVLAGIRNKVELNNPRLNGEANPVLNPYQYANDAFEQQARQVSHDWSHDNTHNQPQHWLAAKVASIPAPKSSAQSLPEAIRSDMESFFKADFSAVKIHTDTQAAALADAEHAEAFAAGAHIFFAAGAYSPSTQAGQALLAHELTHTLQQTGRRSVAGKMRVTDIVGDSTLIQRDALFNELVRVYREEARKEPTTPVESTSRDQRINALQNAENIILSGLGLNPQLNAASGDHQVFVDLEQVILGATGEAYNYITERLDLDPMVVRGFLYDCLKMLGRYEGAAKLIDTAPRLRSYLRPFSREDEELEGFVDYILESETYGRDWIYEQVSALYSTEHSTWPYNILQNLWEYLVRPEVTAERALGYSEIYERYFATAHETGFAENERIYLAHVMAKYLDDTVYEWQVAIDDVYGDRYAEPSVRKINAATAIGEAMQRNQAREFYRDENLLMYRDTGVTAPIASIGRQIKRLADSAISYWRRVSGIYTASEGHSDIEDGLAPSTEAIFVRFVNEVSSLSGDILFSSTDSVVPTMEEYAEAIRVFRETINAYPEQLSNRLQWNIFRYEHRNNERRQGNAAWLGWSIRWIEEINPILNRYQLSEDQARAQGNLHSSDYRLDHRLGMARLFSFFGQLTQRPNLHDAAQDVIHGRDLLESYLIVTGNIQNDSAELERMRGDFSHPIKGLGLTASQLVSVYGIFHLQTFNRRLNLSLRATEGSPILGGAEFVGDAVRQTRDSLKKPIRFSISPEDYEIIYYQQEEGHSPDKSLWEMFSSHRVYQNFETPEGYEGGEVLHPVGHGNELFFWLVPPIQEIVAILRNFTVLNNLVCELADKPISVSHREWFAAFVQLVDEGIDAEGGQTPEQIARRERLLGLVERSIDRSRESTNEQRAYVLRRAMTFRRRFLAQDLTSDLQTYNGSRPIENYTVPNRVLDDIEDFVHLGWDVDSQAQEAALVLALAPEIKEMFIEETWLGTIRENRYDLVTGYYGLLDRAIDIAENNSDRLQHVLFAEENLNDSDRRFHNQAGTQYEILQTLTNNVGQLRDARDSMDTVIADVQSRFGFESDRTHLRSLTIHHSLNVGEAIDIAGNVYQISHVYRAFRFHPAYGLGTDAQSDAKVKNLDGTRYTENASILRFSINAAEEITVRNNAEGLEHLARLDDVIATAAFIASLDNLQRVMEEALETGLDLAELIPGIGQGVMVARILFAIGEFVLRDLPDIKEKLIENPQLVVDHITELIAGELADAAPRFIDAMLFADLPFESNLIAPEEQEDSRRPNPNRGRLNRLFSIVKELAEDALRAFIRLRGRVRGSFVQAQGRIVGNRALLMLVDSVPLLLHLARTVSQNAIEIEEAIDLTDPEALKRSLQEEIQNIVNSFVNIEMPDEIIPMGVAIEVILSFALGKFGRKGKAIRAVLEATNTLGQASDLIAEGLTAAGANPNRLWQEELQSQLQTLLGHIQVELYNEVKELVAQATDNAIVLDDEPNFQESNIEFSGTDTGELELEGYQADPDSYDNQDDSRVFLSEGTPLTKKKSQQFTREFGHDFSHVRIHRSAYASRLVRSSGAKALTSGSHIFVDSRINLDNPGSQHLLRHELSHVLQQVGPRPREFSHSSQPVARTRIPGVTIDKDREAAADRMARRAAVSDWEETIAIEGNGAHGFMPTMEDVSLRLIDDLTDQDVAESQATAYEERVPRSVRRKSTFISATQDARRIWNDVISNLHDPSSSRFYHPLNDANAKTAIQTYLNTFSSEVTQYIPGIVLRSIRITGNGHVRLHHRLFANNLETYLFARTGLVLNIHIDRERADNTHVRYLHLANLSSRSGLWQKMKNNTIHYVETADGSTELEDGTNEIFRSSGNWNRIKMFIGTRMNSSPVWHGSDFRLHNRFIDEVVGLLYKSKDVRVGNWSEYSNADSMTSQTAGMRVATHGQLTGSGMPASARVDRESHHIPQYLLVEYFRNNNDSTKMFANANERLPGFIASSASGDLQGFSVNGSTTDINLQSLDPTAGRGDRLPAISLAAITHQKGRLHMNAASTWGEDDELEGKSNQSAKIDREFIRGVTRQNTYLGPSTEDKTELAAYAQGLSGSELSGFKGNVLTSIKDTYASMYEIMMAALPLALMRYEIPYYKSIAMSQLNIADEDDLPPTHNPREERSSVDGAVAKIREQNNEIMGQWRNG